MYTRHHGNRRLTDRALIRYGDDSGLVLPRGSRLQVGSLISQHKEGVPERLRYAPGSGSSGSDDDSDKSPLKLEYD